MRRIISWLEAVTSWGLYWLPGFYSWPKPSKLYPVLLQIIKHIIIIRSPLKIILQQLRENRMWKHLPEAKTVILFILHGFTTLQLKGLDNRSQQTNMSLKEKQIKLSDSSSVSYLLTSCGGVFPAGSPVHRNMDAAAGLKFVIGLPSSDTTVTENTEQTHTQLLSVC